MTESRIKILFVGPCGAGKSHLVNQLCVDSGDEVFSGNLKPTHSVRILEFDATDNNGQFGKSKPTLDSFDDIIELWDCSGKEDWERCFPAVRKDTVGVVFCYNPEIPEHGAALEWWYERLNPRNLNLSPQQCMVVQLLKSNQHREYAVPNKIGFASIQQPVILTWRETLNFRPHFFKFLEKVFSGVQEKQRAEEEEVFNV